MGELASMLAQGLLYISRIDVRMLVVKLWAEFKLN